MYEIIDVEYKQLQSKRVANQITQEEYEAAEVDILERRGKIKRRMLGNIRFVGELYKKKLLNTETMHECIIELLGSPPKWKPSYDEQDIELLCDLLDTVGETLENKSKKLKSKGADYSKNFDLYFDRLKQLTKDKSLNSRLRFKIEFVIELRNSNWQKRRTTDVPLTLTELHQRLQQEEQNKAANSAPSSSGGRPVSMSGQKTILSRNDSSGSQDARFGGRGGGQRDSYERDSRGGYGGGSGGGSGGGRDDGNSRYGQRFAAGGDRNDRYDDSKGGSGKHDGGRGGRPVSESFNKSSSGGKSSSSASSSTAIPNEESLDKVEFSNEQTRRAVVASVDEIISGIDLSELKLMLKESSSLHTGYYIQVLFDKYSNTSNNSLKDKLLAMLDDNEFTSWLITNKAVVEKAIELYEPLRLLVDTSVDIVQVSRYLFIPFSGVYHCVLFSTFFFSSIGS
jgi:hypothetical protein